MSVLRVVVEDPGAPDVRQLLGRHLEFASTHSPPEDVHALDVDRLRDPAVTFFAGRDEEQVLLAVGALRELDARHGEIKSMHTAIKARGRGAGRQMLDHLLAEARARGYDRVSLETGTMAAFAPARALYTSVGFVPCPPFGDYVVSPNSVCMTLALA